MILGFDSEPRLWGLWKYNVFGMWRKRSSLSEISFQNGNLQVLLILWKFMFLCILIELAIFGDLRTSISKKVFVE